jgi:hypothetical protein
MDGDGRGGTLTKAQVCLDSPRRKSDALDAMNKTTTKTTKALAVASKLPHPSGPRSKDESIRLTPELRKALSQAAACCREIAGVGQREGGTLSDYEADSLAAANEIERLLEGRQR